MLIFETDDGNSFDLRQVKSKFIHFIHGSILNELSYHRNKQISLCTVICIAFSNSSIVILELRYSGVINI